MIYSSLVWLFLDSLLLVETTGDDCTAGKHDSNVDTFLASAHGPGAEMAPLDSSMA